MLGSTDAECDEVFKIWRGTIMEDIVHDCSYFENDAEFYWEPVRQQRICHQPDRSRLEVDTVMGIAVIPR